MNFKRVLRNDFMYLRTIKHFMKMYGFNIIIPYQYHVTHIFCN